MTAQTLLIVGIVLAAPAVTLMFLVAVFGFDEWLTERGWGLSGAEHDPFESWPVLDVEPTPVEGREAA